MATNNTDVNQMLQKGTVLRGIYRIDDYLASGGFGNTYLATNLEFDEHVAIKEFYMKGVTLRNSDSSVSVSHPENVEMFDKLLKTFKREAKRLWKLGMENAPHVVKVFDLFEENNTSYYVMQHINGRSLSGILKANNRPIDESWLMNSLLPQMLEALDAIHSNGMWHLDIKPSNIMLDKDGNAFLIDFGSSKQLDPSSGNATMSSTLSFTKNYAPFEVQQYDLKKIGPWSDIYSLGATLYNLSTNQTPPTAYDIMNEGLRVFKFASGASENFKNLVAWMMRNRTEDRPQNVAQIYESLKTGKVPVANFAPVAPFVPTRNEDTILRNANTTSGREPKSRLATSRGTVMSQNENKGNNKKWLLSLIGIIVGIAAIAGIGWAVSKFSLNDTSESISKEVDSIPSIEDLSSTNDDVNSTSMRDLGDETNQGSSNIIDNSNKTAIKHDSHKQEKKHSSKQASVTQDQISTQKPQNNYPSSSSNQGLNAYERLHGNGGQQQQQSKPSQSQQQKGRNAYEKSRQPGGAKAM